ncbi:hypothetical protein E2C01_053518 [Portunus trituberculatus]|uniref:Uncharacterized protein n=1 Tax=Portunus trituberculatus TaxID=210409 RepID=A0A5B7GR03_PORTR|nr:hypothetical protein [Portunus trituberculatus]
MVVRVGVAVEPTLASSPKEIRSYSESPGGHSYGNYVSKGETAIAWPSKMNPAVWRHVPGPARAGAYPEVKSSCLSSNEMNSASICVLPRACAPYSSCAPRGASHHNSAASTLVVTTTLLPQPPSCQR